MPRVKRLLCRREMVRRERGRSSHGDTAQPAATHIRVEETRAPQWTLDSRLDKLLLEGKERITNMRLNDFLRNCFDGRGVEEFNENVYMKDFLGGPNEFIQDEVLLRTIEASPPCQELKKSVRSFTCYWRPQISLKKNMSSLSGIGVTLRKKIRSLLLQGHR
ncbi:putative retrotransposon hot spot protein (RHS,) [Trypanosoma cruzi]|uniref:Putative retrotransposon hot spot protein (RHS,) n=1 Tax=Trypanosoma cruzi TaxID=5693 RepID=A0A2V2USS4_TRYCR|nr:putative retrotransposon hot spot protein (RHS,) [Trypanosoma cruzi]